MFIEIVDALRCPHPHRDSWLVLGAERMEGRHVMDGVLGCPVCRAQYAIADGIADLRLTPDESAAEPAAGAPEPEQGMRLAALLNLTAGDGFAVLVGDWARHAPAVHAVAETPLLLVNPPAGVAMGEGTSGLRVNDRLPLATASARGVALDARGLTMLGDAANAVQARGRLVGPVTLDVPAGVTELARDAEVWVGERDAGTSGLISLGRGAH